MKIEEIKKIVENSDDITIRSDVAKFTLSLIEHGLYDQEDCIIYLLSFILSKLIDIEDILNHGN